jgi:Zn ribbon nucleic-acid-binding protein
MDAKCPVCEKKATVDAGMTRVRCAQCGYDASFEEYMERMKDRVASIVTDFRDRIDSDQT